MKQITMMMLVAMLSGCTFVTDRYTMSSDNVLAAKSWEGIKVDVGAFSYGENFSVPSCNYKGPIQTVDGEGYPNYIRNALITDLKFAEVYSDKAPIRITGIIEEVDATTASGTRWRIVAVIKSTNGKSVTIQEDYNYNGSIVGTIDSTCNAAAAALTPAVQNLIGKIIDEIPKSLI